MPSTKEKGVFIIFTGSSTRPISSAMLLKTPLSARSIFQA